MTVSTVVNREEYEGNGVTTVFPFRFRILKSSHMVVTVSDPNGALTVLTPDTDYSITGVGLVGGGNVTLLLPLAIGWKISLERDLPAIQETDLRNQGRFYAETHEDAFDYLTMLIQRALSFFNLALKKPSALSSYYDAKNQNISNLADPKSDTDAVNTRSMRGYVDALIAGVTGGYGAFIQRGVAAVLRTFQDKLRDQISIRDYGASEAKPDNTTAINNAILSAGPTGEVLVPNYSTGETTQYRVGNITNKFGTRFTGRGALVQADRNGGIKQINFLQDNFYPVIGYEYLYSMYQKLVPGQGDINGTMNIFLFGDSTIAGNNGESPEFKVDAFLRSQLTRLGIPNCIITNRGVGGSSVGDMNPIPDVTSAADVFIIKYGINDGGNGRPDRLDLFATNLRSKIAAIRAMPNGTLNNLSIILVGPNSTNDSPNNRNAYWYEQLRNIHLQVARDYQCAYFDTYSMMPDSYGLAGYLLDAPPSLAPGVGIHPMNLMQSFIWGKFLDTFFNQSTIAPWRSNNSTNNGAVSGRPLSSVPATSYKFGEEIYRGSPADGYPLDGIVVTTRNVDGPCLQKLFGFGTGPSRCLTRTWNLTGGSWNDWTGSAAGLTPASGWTATNSPEYRVSADGLVTISAYLTGGATATGTSILTGLPAELRPATEKRFAICNHDGTHTAMGINATSGSIFLVGAATSAAGFHVNVSYYAK